MIDNRSKATIESKNSDHTPKTILMFGFESSPLKPKSRSGECDAKIAKHIIECNKSNGINSTIFTLKQTGHWLKSSLGEDLITTLDKNKSISYDKRTLTWFLEANEEKWKKILLDAELLSKRKEEYQKMNSYQRQRLITGKISDWARYIEENNIAAYINSNIPHILDDFIAYQICKMKEIPTLCPYRFPIFPNSISRLLFFEDPLTQEKPLTLKNIKINEPIDDLDQLGSNLPTNNKPKNKKLSIQKKIAKNIKKTLRRRTLEKFETYKLPKQFIYYPLHFQPEASSRPLGGIWGDQILLVELLASKLPDNLELVVKEHPLQLEKGEYRGKSFYESITSLPNTTLISHKTDSKELIKRSQATATLTGTIALESLTYNKKCFIFGASVFRNAPNAITPRSNKELADQLIELTRKTNHGLSEASKKEFFNFIRDHSIFAYLDPYTDPRLDDQLSEAENIQRVSQIYNWWIKSVIHDSAASSR